MSSSAAERQLLFGLLALQNGFITRDQLVSAFGSWSADKRRALDAILLEQGALVPARRELLSALIEAHLAQHGGDPEASLARLSPIAAVREKLDQLRDSELSQGLTHVPAQPIDLPETEIYSAESLSRPGGRFQVLRKHARGGLGQVWIAMDTELHREVAFKEILPKYAHGEEARTRFLREAEITGGLEHPGIVPVYSLGTYADGRLFYAMKFIKGDSLKTVLKEFHARRTEGKSSFDSSEFRQLLRRFVDVCNALQYAHDRGVLHRDLKPGNVMLGQYGETLVVDWGLAKPLGEQGTEIGPTASGEKPLVPRASLKGSSGETLHGRAVGTPQFMSPEQARGEIDQLGPATDIYALGATLFHILAGIPPFDGDDLGEILQQVQKGQFAAPRQVLSSIPKPLEAICLKAMALEPAGRYPTPQALAKEIEHWLADEPVSAAPDRLTQRAARFARKHRGMVGTGIAALLLIAVGTAFGYLREAGLRNNLARTNESLTTALANEKTALAKEKAARTAETAAKQHALAEQARATTNEKRAKENEQRALAAEQTAEENATAARQQTHLALDTLNSVVIDIQGSLENVAGTLPLRRRLLQAVSMRLEQIAAEFSQSGVKDRLAAVAMTETADVLLRMGGTEEEFGGSAIIAARRLYQQAHEIMKQLANALPEDSQAQLDLSISYDKLGDVTFQAGTLTAARGFYQQSLEINKRLADAAPDDAQAQRSLSTSYCRLGEVTLRLSELTAARRFFEKAQEIAQQLADASPDDIQAQRDLSLSYLKLGEVTSHAGDLTAARRFFEQTLDIVKRLAEAAPDDTQAQRDLSVSYEKLGDMAIEAGDLTAAREFYQQAREIKQRLADVSPDDAQAQRDLSVSYERLGDVTLRAGDLTAAREFHQQSLEIAQRLADASPDDAQAQCDLSISYNKLGDVTLRAGDLTAAREFHQQSLEIAQRLADASPDDAQAQGKLSLSYTKLGEVTLRAGDLTAAREFHQQSLEIDKRLAEAAPDDARAQRDLMVCYCKRGGIARSTVFDFEVAGAEYRHGLAVLEAFTMRTGLKPFEAENDFLNSQIALCETMARGIMDLTSLEALPAGNLLYQRERALTHYSRSPAADLPAAVRKKWSGGKWRLDLLEEAAKTAASSRGREKGQYIAGRGFGLCLSALDEIAADPEMAADLGDETALPELRKEWTALAMECLTAAVASGYDNADYMAQDADLEQLRELPEFQALLKQMREKK